MDRLYHHLHTLFLFTKADMKCAMLSIVVFALATTHTISFSFLFPSTLPLLFQTELLRLLRTTAWVWLHLLHHTIANQCTNPSEDALNKPNRPLPSGRITLRNAQRLRWAFAPICLAYSAVLYGREVASITAAIIVLVVVYNDLGGDAHWLIRDCVNAGLFATFASGASLIASPYPHTLSPTSLKAILINTLLYATTNYSQDFKDVVGDARVGRRTVPIVFPSLARPLLMPLLVSWAVGLAVIWEVGLTVAVPFVGAAAAIGWRYLVERSETQDKKSTQMYIGWLSIAHLLPAYYRIASTAF